MSDNPFDKLTETQRDANVEERPGLVLVSRRPLTTEEFERRHGGIKKLGPVCFEEDGVDYWYDGNNELTLPPGAEE